MTTETARNIIGLSAPGYTKQAGGDRALSRQTILLTLAWDLMAKAERETFLQLASALDALGKSRARTDYSLSDSQDADKEKSQRWERVFVLIDLVGRDLDLLATTKSDAERHITRSGLERRIRELKQACKLLTSSGALDA